MVWAQHQHNVEINQIAHNVYFCVYCVNYEIMVICQGQSILIKVFCILKPFGCSITRAGEPEPLEKKVWSLIFLYQYKVSCLKSILCSREQSLFSLNLSSCLLLLCIDYLFVKKQQRNPPPNQNGSKNFAETKNMLNLFLRFFNFLVDQNHFLTNFAPF